MSDIATGLDALIDRLTTALPTVTVTRDPAGIVLPCLFVDIPTITSRGMGSITFTAPVRIIVPGPGDLTAAELLLELVTDVLDACGEAEAEPGTFAQAEGAPALPCMTVTTTISIQRS
jgi:hypothetical protein